MEQSEQAAVGIDLGSRMTKIVRLVRGGAAAANALTIAAVRVFDTGHNPLERLREALGELIRPGDAVVATGYGRNLAQAELACRTVTEIRACARAAAWLCDAGSAGGVQPGRATYGVQTECGPCTCVIDIGGQDAKAIELAEGGSFGRFEMNDRCAAGTGRFLEVMAAALGYSVEEFGAAALAADRPVPLTSMCTVFAESEVVSLVARGEDRRRIALGLHVATARRVAAMASRIGPRGRLMLVGGVARNPCMAKMLAEELGAELVIPERPELAVAVGAALIGLDGDQN